MGSKQCRHNRLKGTLSDAAPILWQYGALARLKKGEPIDKLLYGGYSTVRRRTAKKPSAYPLS